MRAHLSLAQQSALMFVVLGVAAVALIAYLVSRWKTLSPLAYVCFVLLARLYFFEFNTLVRYPEERLHFLEYGVLAILLHRAFSIDWQKWRPRGLWPYVGALVAGALIGWGDEGVQGLTKHLPAVFNFFGIDGVSPLTFRRYFGWGDVYINALGVAYGLAFLATVLRNRQKTMIAVNGKC